MSGGGKSGNNGQTLSYTVSAGGNVSVSFNAGASQPGTGSVTGYSWASNGTVIDSRQSFSFVFGPGTHAISLKVTNSAGLTNTATATIQVSEAASPQVSGISPGRPPRKDADQELVVSGSGFQSGLTVTAVLPSGGSVLLSGTQIRNVGQNSFTLVITLNQLGRYGIIVNNPDGGRSSTFNFSTQQPNVSSISPSSPRAWTPTRAWPSTGAASDRGSRSRSSTRAAAAS